MSEAEREKIFTDEELREKSVQMLKDESVNWSMLVMIGAQRLAALANMVLERTLTEEEASPQLYRYMVDSARAKARDSGTDLEELLRVMQQFVPPFIQEEMSRLRSQQETQDLIQKRRKTSDCLIGVRDHEGQFRQHLLLILGKSEQVATAIDDLLQLPIAWRYADDLEPLNRKDVVYLNHRASDDFGCRTLPLQDWGSTTENVRDWGKLTQRLPGKHPPRYLVISNLNVAGKFPPPRGKSLASAVKTSVATLSRWLATNDTVIVSGVYFPQQHEPGFEDDLRAYAAKRSNVTVWSLEKSKDLLGADE